MSSDVLGMVVPHPPIMVEEVGGAEAHVTDATRAAMRDLASLLSDFAPQTLVVVSPHAPSFADAFSVTSSQRLRGDLGAFRAGDVVHDAEGDPDLAAAIVGEAERLGVPTVAREDYLRRHGDQLDHGALVPLSFLDPESRFQLVEVSFTNLGTAAHVLFGRAIATAARTLGRRIALVASGDMSHRLTPGAPAGYSTRAHFFDEQVERLLAADDFRGIGLIDPALREEAGECGWRSLLILGGFLEGADRVSRVLSYEGPWGVGYLTAVFASEDRLARFAPATPTVGRKGGMKGTDASDIVRLARVTVEQYVRHQTVPDPPHLSDPDLPLRAGVFVTLHLDGELRGCIGTIGPTHPSVAAEVIHNAVQAATADPRFPPVAEYELDDLDIKVDVLHPAERVDSLAELDPRTYGVITTSGWKRGLLLPDLEGVDTPQQQVGIAMRKAGIGQGESVSLERFKVDRYA